MREQLLLENLVSAVAEQVAPGRRVRRLHLEVGRLRRITPDALRECFDACVRGTVLEGATLEVRVLAGRLRCRRCERISQVDDGVRRCPCGSADVEIVAGEELRLRKLEVA